MTRNDIIRMAREAGADSPLDCTLRLEDAAIIRFYDLAVAAEREACAKLCDEFTTDDTLESCNDRTVIRHELAECLAAAIRARGNA